MNYLNLVFLADSLDEPNMEPPHPPTPVGPPATQAEFQLDPATAALYEPAEPESFRGMRRRFDNQETAIFGPLRRLRQQQAAPYQERQPPPHFPDDPENVNHAFRGGGHPRLMHLALMDGAWMNLATYSSM